MSTTEPKVESLESNVVSIKKTYEIYNDNLELVSKEVTVNFTPPLNYEEAVSRLGNDINKMLEGLTAILRREELNKARKEAGVSGGINRAVLMEFIKPYRELPQFASLITATDKRKATAEEWNKQTSEILNQIKNVPFIMDSIRQASAKVEDNE